MVVSTDILVGGNLDYTWCVMAHLLHRSRDATKLGRRGALLRKCQPCEIQLDARYPGLHHIWTLEKILTRELYSYDLCDRVRRIPIDVFYNCDFSI